MGTVAEILKNLKEALLQIDKMSFGVMVLLLIGFLAYIFKEPIGKYLLQDNSMRPLEKTVGRDVLMYGVMEDMLNEFGGGRVYIYTFHNGQNYLSEDEIIKHKQRASMDYEVVANGVIEIGLRRQNIPVSLFALQLNAILDEEILGISRKEAKTAAARNIMAQTGVSHTSILPYRDKDKKVIMIIGVDWVMQEDIEFDELRFRKWVNEIGDLFMGYSETAKIWNLKDSKTRGIADQANLYPSIDGLSGATAKKEDGETFHFILGTKALPLDSLFLSQTIE